MPVRLTVLLAGSFGAFLVAQLALPSSWLARISLEA